MIGFSLPIFRYITNKAVDERTISCFDFFNLLLSCHCAATATTSAGTIVFAFLTHNVDNKEKDHIVET